MDGMQIQDRPAATGARAPTPAWRRALLPLALFGLLAAALGVWRSQPGAHSVTLEQARAALESGQAVLIDLREPHEHATGVAQGAHLLPMRQLAQRAGEIPRDTAVPVYLVCATQNRSRATLERLHAQGLTHVRYVHGGMTEWARRGWPLVPPDPAALRGAATLPR
jgi:rhodanese-related sulfurtransferase